MLANIQLFQLRLSPEQSGKFIPSSLSRSYSTFPLCSGATLIEIAVCGVVELCKVMTRKSKGKEKSLCIDLARFRKYTFKNDLGCCATNTKLNSG
jgi:hypothetical protein